MSIYDSKPRKTYAVGATAQAAFAVPFTFWKATDLRVYVDDVLLTSGYTVAGGDGAGGTVTLATPVSNTTVAVVRRLKIERTTDFPNAGPLKTPAVNRQFDQHVAILQQLDDDGARSLKLPETEDPEGAALPALAARAGRVLGFDADGRPTVSTSSIAQLDALTLAALQAGKVAEVIEPFEADGTTSTIATAAPLVAAAQVTLLIGGIIQRPESGAYTVAAAGSGGLITLAEPPPAGVVVGGFVGYATEVGKIVDDVGIVGGHLIIAYVDGETVDLGQVVGADGADGANGTNGRGIASATVDGSGHLILTYTDSTTTDAGLVVGGVTSVAGRTGAVTLAVADVSGAAPLASPALTGTPTAPTAANGTNTSQIASTAFVQAAIAALLNSAPATLDTLNELATALGNDPNFATTITNALAGKASLTGATFSGKVTSTVSNDSALSIQWGEIGGNAGAQVWFSSNLYHDGTTWRTRYTHASLGATAIILNGVGFGNISVAQVTGATVAGGAVAPTYATLWHGGNLPASSTVSQPAAVGAAGSASTFSRGDHAHQRQLESIIIACGDETTAITAGTSKVSFRMPYAFTVTAVYAELVTAQTSGSIFTVDINEAGTSILSTKLTIDNTETDSATAATAAVISDAALAARALITIDVDQIGDGTAKGLKVTLIGRQSA